MRSNLARRTALVRPPISLRMHVMPIFANLCQICHPSIKRLDLTLSGIFTTAVNVDSLETPAGSCARTRIKPYEPDASYLVHKIQGTHLGACVMGSGVKMPLGGPYLSQTQIDVVREWIQQGCMNN